MSVRRNGWVWFMVGMQWLALVIMVLLKKKKLECINYCVYIFQFHSKQFCRTKYLSKNEFSKPNANQNFIEVTNDWMKLSIIFFTFLSNKNLLWQTSKTRTDLTAWTPKINILTRKIEFGRQLDIETKRNSGNTALKIHLDRLDCVKFLMTKINS